MGLIDWFRKTREDVSDHGFNGLVYSLHQLHWGGVRRLDPLFDDGTNFYEHNWDVLILLDACRLDAMKEVEEEYSFLNSQGKIRSPGSTSSEWMANTFTEYYENEVQDTIYVTANPQIERFDFDFHYIDKVYEWGWDQGHDTVLAETVTDAAIEASRRMLTDDRRLIIHYLQPHFPSVPDPIGHGGNKVNKASLRLWNDSLSEERYWESYIKNLRYVLDSVDDLLNNIDADEVAISADHGEAKGEWGIYGHPHGMPISCLRDVPWYLTSATDSGDRLPMIKTRDKIPVGIDKQLEALGYKE